jgi:hypothetical protein
MGSFEAAPEGIIFEDGQFVMYGKAGMWEFRIYVTPGEIFRVMALGFSMKLWSSMVKSFFRGVKRRLVRK